MDTILGIALGAGLIGALMTTLMRRGGNVPGYLCAACETPLVIEDRQAFALRCPTCETEYRRVGGQLLTRAEYERHDPRRIPQARIEREGHE